MRILHLCIHIWNEFRRWNSGLPPMEFLISAGGNQDFFTFFLTTKLTV
jgi:hypothetical protein